MSRTCSPKASRTAWLLRGVLAFAALQMSAGSACSQTTPSIDDVKASILRGDTKTYECAYVVPKGDKEITPYCPVKDKSPGAQPRTGKVLSPENGDVVVVIKAVDYFSALKAMDGKPPQLSLNGLNMAGSARQAGSSQDDSLIRLRFSVTQVDTQEARDFWSATYQRVGFGQLTPLYVSLGWPANPNYFRPDSDDGIPDILYVTSQWRLAVAAVLGLIVVGGYFWALKGSDIFRVGAKLDTGKRQAYSFARVQWGVWTTYAVASAVFLWTVYGFFPGLSETVLALAGVSTLAATTSFFMDSNNPTVPEKSVNFWVDMLSGSGDSTAQAHRFQALAVNAVMLVGAVYYVFDHLGYPRIDPTWLAMLGISDAGQLAGKQLLEGQNAPSGDLPVATLPPAPNGTAPPVGDPAPDVPPAVLPAAPVGDAPSMS